jgi:hypothetical protein
MSIKGDPMKIFWLVCVCVLMTVCVAFAEPKTYYVNGPGGENGEGSDYNHNGLSPDEAFRSMHQANVSVKAGDQVKIFGGTYHQAVNPQASGRKDAYIEYMPYNDEKVVITGDAWNLFGIHLFGVSYIKVSGIHGYELYQHLIMDNASHNIIENCSFIKSRPYRDTGISWNGSWIHNNSTHNRISNCVFGEYGWFNGQDNGVVLNIGSQTHTANDRSDYNVVENSTLYHGGHHVLGINTRFNVIRKNYLHNEKWNPGDGSDEKGNRIISVFGGKGFSERNLIEHNTIAFTDNPPDDNGASGIKIVTPYNIVRYNRISHCKLAGISLYTHRGNSDYYNTSPYANYIYQNTFYKNGYLTDPVFDLGPEAKVGLGMANYGYPENAKPIEANVVINNIFHQNYGEQTFGFNRVVASAQVIDSNWTDDNGDPIFIDISAAPDPLKPDLYDFKLRPHSPCIDGGRFLTRIASNDAFGKRFVVENAGFFTDGWGIVEGDLIQLEGENETIRIVAIDYETNVIEVDQEIEWMRNQGISLPYQGMQPDMGAYEYGQDMGI